MITLTIITIMMIHTKAVLISLERTLADVGLTDVDTANELGEVVMTIRMLMTI